MFQRFLKDESGVTVIEYGLITAFVLCAILATLASMSPQMPIPFTKVSNGITAAIGN